MTIYLNLTPRDPLISRDGRPFGAGQGLRMRSLDWPYPSVLAGSLRSLLGKRHSGAAVFPADLADQLKAIEVAGPLPVTGGELYFPAPGDFLVYKDDDGVRRTMVLRPDLQAKASCDLPPFGLVPMAVTQEAKPDNAPAFWSSSLMARWLTGEDLAIPPENATAGSGFLDAPEKEERMHVSIDPDTYAARESQLFKTVGLAFDQDVALSVRVKADAHWAQLLGSVYGFHPLGGERRLVHWRNEERPLPGWECPEPVQRALASAKADNSGVRLILATPTLFKHGWRPDWLKPAGEKENGLEGAPPGCSLRLRLTSACVQRWKPISGWNLKQGEIGPKPLRRLVPAGSVYFFELLEGDAGELGQRYWLTSVADDGQDQRDGFGLALWGIWKPRETR